MNTKRVNPSCRPGTTEAMERLSAENEALRSDLTKTSQDLQYWYKEAERRLDENNELRAELEATANLAIKQGEWPQSIVNITKGEPEGLKHHSTHDVVESVEALRVERDETMVRVKQLREDLRDATQSLLTISAQAGKDELMIEMIDVRGYAGSRAIVASNALSETPAQSVAIVQCKAISDAMEYAIDQVGSDASADDCVDAMCEYLEQVSEGKFSTVGSTGNTWRSIKAAGAREALQRALYPPNFSDTVVRVDRLQTVIADMENES